MATEIGCLAGPWGCVGGGFVDLLVIGGGALTTYGVDKIYGSENILIPGDIPIFDITYSKSEDKARSVPVPLNPPKSETNCPPNGPNDPCDSKLSGYEINKLQRAGIDIHAEKSGFGGPPKYFDLYKCRNGDIVIKRKGGGKIISRTGLNINRY